MARTFEQVSELLEMFQSDLYRVERANPRGKNQKRNQRLLVIELKNKVQELVAEKAAALSQ